jgi:putative membrane protein
MDPREQLPTTQKVGTSHRITEHLANERTFLAWIRTGLATITFGFVIERFGLALQQLGFNDRTAAISYHFSSVFGVSLTVLGVVVLVVALVQFLRNRNNIDAEQFHPSASFPIILTIVASAVGIMLAIYVGLTG